MKEDAQEMFLVLRNLIRHFPLLIVERQKRVNRN